MVFSQKIRKQHNINYKKNLHRIQFTACPLLLTNVCGLFRISAIFSVVIASQWPRNRNKQCHSDFCVHTLSVGKKNQNFPQRLIHISWFFPPRPLKIYQKKNPNNMIFRSTFDFYSPLFLKILTHCEHWPRPHYWY